MIYPENIAIRKKHVVCKALENEGIILNLNTGDCYNITESGLFIWRSLGGRRKLREVVSDVVSKYNVDRASAETDILKFIKALHARDLIELKHRK